MSSFIVSKLLTVDLFSGAFTTTLIQELEETQSRIVGGKTNRWRNDICLSLNRADAATPSAVFTTHCHALTIPSSTHSHSALESFGGQAGPPMPPPMPRAPAEPLKDQAWRLQLAKFETNSCQSICNLRS